MVAYNRESNGQGTRAEDGPWKPQIETPAQPTGSDQWISATPRRRDEGRGRSPGRWLCHQAPEFHRRAGDRASPGGCHGRMGFRHSGVDCSCATARSTTTSCVVHTKLHTARNGWLNHFL